MLMVAVAIFAGLMAEIRQRPARFARLSMMHYDRANARLDQVGRLCKVGQTPRSIDDFYARQGPAAWRDWQTAKYHFGLAARYAEASNEPWLPVLPDLPPPGNPRDVGATAQWANETFSALVTWIGLVGLILTFHLAVGRTRGRTCLAPPGSSRRHPGGTDENSSPSPSAIVG
jgi:hypothetical protein